MKLSPATIEFTESPFLPKSSWREASKFSGVYGLYQDTSLVYIGATKSILSRMRRHSKREFNQYKFIRIKDYFTHEKILIKELNPLLNGKFINPNALPRIGFELKKEDYRKAKRLATKEGFQSVAAYAKHLFVKHLLLQK